MKIFYDNHTDYAATLISASSAQADLPASNVAQELRAQVWRTGTAGAAEWIAFDLGSSNPISSVILLDHTLLETDMGLLIEGSDDNFATIRVSENLPWTKDAILCEFNEAVLRYWRIKFTKTTAGSTRDIGRIFLGEPYSTIEQPDDDAYEETLNDPSAIAKGIAGQTYCDRQTPYRTLKVGFTHSPNCQVEVLKRIADCVGRTVSFFVQVFPDPPLNRIWYVKMSDAGGRKVDGPVQETAGDFIWEVSLELEEQL